MEFNWETVPSESECIAYLEHKRWGGIVVSPFSAASKVYKCGNSRYKCQQSGKYFNVKTSTLFHNSKIPVRIWFAAILIAGQKKITSVELGKTLGITQKSAWYILRRLKKYEIASSATAVPVVENTPNPDRLSITDWLTLMRK